MPYGEMRETARVLRGRERKLWQGRRSGDGSQPRKPVVFYCDQEKRRRFYRDVHPLSRLIEFETGVAVGAMVTDRLQDVSELIYRIFENRMVYCLEQSK